MKNKVYIIGPVSSGKTTFMHKMINKDYAMFKDNIIESTIIPENIDDALQVYLILPEKEELKKRGGNITEDELEKYMEFYYKNTSSTIIVEDF